MPKATGQPTTPAPYKLGHHPRRTDHAALLHADGTVAATFALDATRAEIAAKLGERGLVLHDDDTVTQAAAEPAPSRRRLLSAFAGAAFAGPALVLAASAQAAGTLPVSAETKAMSDDAHALRRRIEAELDAEVHPDAELLAALAEFEVLEQRIWAERPMTIEAERVRDILVAPLHEEQDRLLDRICTLQARTPEGWKARVRVLVGWSPDYLRDLAADVAEDGYWNDRMVLALVRDMAAAGVVSSLPGQPLGVS